MRESTLVANDRLRGAMQAAQLDVEQVATAVGVDPKTVQRWPAGRQPRARHRWALVDLLSEQEALLWPAAGGLAAAAKHTAEVVAVYAHRADAPLSLWSRLLFASQTRIDLLGCAMLFFPEQHPDLPAFVRSQGVRMRVMLLDPEGEETQRRDELERLAGTLPGRIRTTPTHFDSLRDCPDVELRFVNVPLYNAVYRFDDQMLVTPYLYRRHGFQHPLLHLRRLGPDGPFAGYLGQFEELWATATAVPAQEPHGAR